MRDWKIIDYLARNLESTRVFMRGLDTELAAVLELDTATMEDCKRMMDMVGESITRFKIVERMRQLEGDGEGL